MERNGSKGEFHAREHEKLRITTKTRLTSFEAAAKASWVKGEERVLESGDGANSWLQPQNLGEKSRRGEREPTTGQSLNMKESREVGWPSAGPSEGFPQKIQSSLANNK